MPTKSTASAVKLFNTNPGMMVATLVAGAVLATAGWWYSDRLALSLGDLPSINESGEGGDCKEGEVSTNAYTDSNGDLKVQGLKCINNGSYITRLRAVKMRSGVALVPMTTTLGIGDNAFVELVKTIGTGPRWITIGTQTFQKTDLKSGGNYNEARAAKERLEKMSDTASKNFEKAIDMMDQRGR